MLIYELVGTHIVFHRVMRFAALRQELTIRFIDLADLYTPAMTFSVKTDLSIDKAIE